MNHLFYIGLFIHIIGITCIAGGSIGGLILENYFWNLIHHNPEKSVVVLPLMSKYPIIIQVGTILMLISGLMILDAVGWGFADQWWFIIKMALVVALVLNGMLVAKPNSKKLITLVPKFINGKEGLTQIQKVKRTMVFFHVSELTMLLLVYMLAVFQF